ncbi:hypothetical protein [Paenibacillus sp. CF384]|uniref:hypothetical protein n=1 Tax=Paenibacillus sp. CF384 TaxID=1884382 RepID=UPI00089C84E3|nr:hypothetical protein [Paenibacillus sp. CF384]SDX67289.1 hypothetical protein SAMN05518855_1018108 [Paenibacillus sp. CF384]
MKEHSRSDSKIYIQHDAASTVMNEALIDYYLDTRNFKAIAKLQEYQSQTCSTCWIKARDSADGTYYVPEQVMEQIQCKINAIAASGTVYIADPIYFIEQMREQLVTEYLNCDESPYYFVPI